MIGSEKQIAWAEKIRPALIAQWNEAVAAASAKAPAPDAAPIVILRGIVEYAATIEDASFWIDSRGGRILLDVNRQKIIREKFGVERKAVLGAVDHLLSYVNILARQREGAQ